MTPTTLSNIPLDKLGAVGVTVVIIVLSSYFLIYKIVSMFIKRGCNGNKSNG